MSGATGTETETRTFRAAVNGALAEELERDDDVFLMGEEITVGEGAFDATAGLHDRFGPDRVRDTPISEAGFVGAGVGAAATGTRPVLEMGFSTFLGVAFEQVHNQLCLLRYMTGGTLEFPLTIRAVEGGGINAAAQHSKTLHTVFAHLPGVKVVVPGTAAAAKGLTKAAIRSADPVIVFEHKRQYAEEGEVPVGESFTVPIGEASVERAGEDVTVVATQRYVSVALALAEELADVDVEVIDLRSLYPLDAETVLGSVRKTGRLVVADESPLSYGVHAEVAARVAESAVGSLQAPVQRVGVPDTPVPFSPPMETEVVPDSADLRRAVERVV